MNALPTQENAFTKRAFGARRARRSMSDSACVVKNARTPSFGGASAMGFVASMTTLPASASGPASAIASSAAVPFTASTTTDAAFAASANVPTRPLAPARCCQAASFFGSREPRKTS